MNQRRIFESLDYFRLPVIKNNFTDPRYQDFLNALNERLMVRSDYIGLSPYGSQFKGYATSNSDFDVFILGGNGMIDIQEMYSEIVSEIGAKFGKEANFPEMLDYDFFVINLKVPGRFPSNQGYTHASYALTYPIIGKTDVIDYLRRMARKKHTYMRQNHINNAVRNEEDALRTIMYFDIGINYDCSAECVDKAINWNGNTCKKILNAGISHEELRILAKRRAVFWRRRMKRLIF